MEKVRFWVGSLFFLVLLSYLIGPDYVELDKNFNKAAKQFSRKSNREVASTSDTYEDPIMSDDLYSKYQTLPSVEVQAADAVEKMVSRFDAQGKPKPNNSEKCNCSLAGELKGEVTYESYDSASCNDSKEAIITVKVDGLKVEKKIKGNRNYLRESLAQVSDDYRLKRNDPVEGKFPQACMVFIMKDFLSFMKSKTEDVANGIFVTCPNASGKPERGALKPCVTTDYVSTVYNSLIDVSDCLDIPQKDIVPKIYNESGFHGVSYGAGDDTGVGQLTGAAIEDVNVNLKTYKNRISASNKASCQRLKKVPGIFKEVDVDSDKRCALVMPPANPMRNVLYSGILFKQNKIYVENAMKKHDIDKLLLKAGLSNFNRDEIIRMMASLGYNAGPASAVLYLKRYLLESIDAIANGKRKSLTNSDFDFRKGFELIDKTKAAGKDPKEIPIAELTLPEFLRIHSQTGAPGYLSFLQRMHQRLSNAFGEGTCSPAGYLVL